MKPTMCHACTARSRYQLPRLVTTRMVCVPTCTVWCGDSSLGPTTTLSHQCSDWCVVVSKETKFQWDAATQLTSASATIPVPRVFLRLSQLSSSILHARFKHEPFPPSPISFGSHCSISQPTTARSTVASFISQLQRGFLC